VIGGGASGMMAALSLGLRNKKVLLIEKNKKLGEKVKISGGGRCNITNANFDKHDFLKNYGESAPFLYSPFSQFSVKDTMSFFEENGLALKVEAQNRVFPKSEKSTDVILFFLKLLKENKVKVLTNTTVTKVVCEKNSITNILVGNDSYQAKNYVLATGGVSHPETGSTGDGFDWLSALGHKVKAPTPTIVPIKTSDKWIHSISGITLSEVKITFYKQEENKNKKAFSKRGNILCTHFGLSGPTILNSSSLVWDLLQEGNVIAKIDLYPDMEINILDEYIRNIFDNNKNKILKNVIKEILPLGSLRGISLLLSEIDLDKKIHNVTKLERKRITELFKNLPVNITNLMGYDRAVIADGGVTLAEIDTKTMNSKIIHNLFITGDLLNINRPSGGYSLQLCWTTGFIAGKNA
jgi:predicted Rossmann fold flavoprotein